MQNLYHKKYSGLDELIILEEMRNYNKFIVSQSLKHIKNLNQVIDLGAGIGTLSIIFREKFKLTPLCIEIDDVNKEYLKKRNFNVFDSLEEISCKSDSIFSSNVLEHIQNDLDILKQMKNNLTDEGLIYLYLPAKMSLWTDLDKTVGHYRRYEINEIREKFKSCGLKIVALHYSDSAGFFATLLMRFFGYESKSGIGSVGLFKFHDKWLFPISKIMDIIGFKYLFGKNLILVAKKI